MRTQPQTATPGVGDQFHGRYFFFIIPCESAIKRGTSDSIDVTRNGMCSTKLPSVRGSTKASVASERVACVFFLSSVCLNRKQERKGTIY